jgi:SAM-dependent methyltransferase
MKSDRLNLALMRELPLPEGTTEETILSFFKSFPISLPPWNSEVIENYSQYHLRRLIYTLGLVKDLKGRCLELGSAPYFMTLLLKQFTDLDLVLANYFGKNQPQKFSAVSYNDFYSGKKRSMNLDYHHFNIEESEFPFHDAEFDVVIFCEILEHLCVDPLTALKEIKRVLNPGGALILTTPNSNRLENIAKMIAGINIYDPYSGYYGPYGRHNREYNVSEILHLLDYCGFAVEEVFTSDIIANKSRDYLQLEQLEILLSGRRHDLGQFIFIRAINAGKCRKKRPSFLYANFPSHELEPVNAEVIRGHDIIKDRHSFLIRSWYGCENWNGTPTRWIGQEALILLPSETECTTEMSFQATSFNRPRNMEIFAEDVLLLKVLVTTDPSRISIEVPLIKGINYIMFKAIEGCEMPRDIKGLNSRDERCLCFALQNVTFSSQ